VTTTTNSYSTNHTEGEQAGSLLFWKRTQVNFGYLRRTQLHFPRTYQIAQDLQVRVRARIKNAAQYAKRFAQCVIPQCAFHNLIINCAKLITEKAK
jgi:hypothetical protein